MDRLELAEKFQAEINSIYKEHELDSLSGPDHNYIVCGRNILEWHGDVIIKGQQKFSNSFNFLENFQDILFCSEEIMYFTALMFYYRPYLNDPIKDAISVNGELIYPNHENQPAKRYHMFASTVSEKVFNFWERIAQLLATYFPEIFRIRQRVSFNKVMENLPDDLKNSDAFKWLKGFHENAYQKLNNYRREHVHYKTQASYFRHEHLKRVADKEELQKLIDERNKLADFFKEQIDLTIEGFKQTLNLIEVINENRLYTIE